MRSQDTLHIKALYRQPGTSEPSKPARAKRKPRQRATDFSCFMGVRVSEALAARIRAVSEAQGKTMSDVIREAVQALHGGQD